MDKTDSHCVGNNVLCQLRIPIMKKFSSLRVCILFFLLLVFAVQASAETNHLRSVRSIKMQQITAEGRAPAVTGLSLSTDGKKLVTVGDDHKARIWNVSDGSLLHTLSDQKDWIRTVKFSADGKFFVTGGMDDTLYSYDAESFARKFEFIDAGTSVRAIAFNPTNSSRVAVVGFDSTVSIYDTALGRRMHSWQVTSNDQRAVAFSPDSHYIATAGRDGVVCLYNTARNMVHTHLKGHRSRIWSISFSPDGEYLATGGEDRKIIIWSAKTFAKLKEIDFPSGKVSAITFCGPNMLAAGSTNNQICVWNIGPATPKMVYVMDEHQGTIAELLWDDMSKTLISCSFDSTVRFWNWQVPDMAIENPSTTVH